MRILCSICKEIFIPYSEIKVTSCGHIYHGSCIMRWYKQHNTCPQCRSTLSTQPFRVYFDVDKDNTLDPSTLEHQIETLTDKLRQSETISNNLREENEKYERIMEGMKECAIALKEKNDILKTSVRALKEQISNLSKQTEMVIRLEEEVEVWKSKVKTLQRVETLVKGSSEEVNKMLEITPVTQLAVRQLCTYVGILKVQLQKSEARQAELYKENRDLLRFVAADKKNDTSALEEELKNLKTSYSSLEKKFFILKNRIKEYKEIYGPEENEKSSLQTSMQGKKKKPAFKIDFGMLDKAESQIDEKNNTQVSKRISNWEEIVCAGPSRNFGDSFKSKSYIKNLPNDILDESHKSKENYAFDGLGGRKKIRLGGPTPKEEFEKIKKFQDKKTLTNLKPKKIIDYYQARSVK